MSRKVDASLHVQVVPLSRGELVRLPGRTRVRGEVLTDFEQPTAFTSDPLALT